MSQYLTPRHEIPMAFMPALNFSPDPDWQVPDKAACLALCDKYAMLPHIREHCRLVALVAAALAAEVQARALKSDGLLSPATANAAGMLHDIAKTYTIEHGGSHAELGAAWVLAETRHQGLAQAVYHHVAWPWLEGELSVEARPFCLPLVVSYADKRVRHDELVTLTQRFEDLLQRYGKTARSRVLIQHNWQQSLRLEQTMTALLEFPLEQALSEHTLDSGRLVA